MSTQRTLIAVMSRTILRAQHVLYPRNRNKLLVLYLHADANRYPHSYSQLRRLLELCGESFVVKIDNFATHSRVISSDWNTVGIAGDNSFWEFSGWKKGLSFAQQKLAGDFSHVLFVNDAFLNKTNQGSDLTYYRRLFNRINIVKIGKDVLGDVSSAPGRHILRGCQVNRWIKSSIFCVSYDTALQLPLNHLSEELLDEIIPSKFRPGPLLNPHPWLNDEFRDFVKEWLTIRWQWRLTINEQNWPLLRGKVAAIINERLLTIDLERLHCRLLTAKSGRHLGVKRIGPAE